MKIPKMFLVPALVALVAISSAGCASSGFKNPLTKSSAPKEPTIQKAPAVSAPAFTSVRTHPLLVQEPTAPATSPSAPLLVLSRPGTNSVSAPTTPPPSSRRALVIGKTGSDYVSVLFRNRTGQKTRVLVDNGVADFTLEDKDDQVVLVERGVASILYDAEHAGGRDLQELQIGARNAIVVTIVK